MHNTCWPLGYVPQGVVTGDCPRDCSLEICSASCVDTNRNPEYREARSKSPDFPVHPVRPGPLVTHAAFRDGFWEVTFVRFGLVGIKRAPYPREHLRISETGATCRFVHYRRRRSRARSRLDRAIPTRPNSDGQMSNALSPPGRGGSWVFGPLDAFEVTRCRLLVKSARGETDNIQRRARLQAM